MSTDRRPSLQRQAVATFLSASSEFHTAQQIFETMRSNGSTIGLATVYRAVQSMAADGTVDVLRLDDGEASYRACSSEHHHHLVCRECGTAVEIGGQQVETWASNIARAHGFSNVNHNLELFGTCEKCTV